MIPYSNQQPYEFNPFNQGPFPYPEMQQQPPQPPEYFMPPHQGGMSQASPAVYQPPYGYQENVPPFQPPEAINQPQMQSPGMMPMQQPMNPYPLPRPQKQQSSQFKSVLSQFKKTNGQFDFNKMFDTAGQMMSTMNQVGSLAKGFTSIFKA
ncbi:YppG family protein [Bacillus sp. FSL K6-4563]|uniref:YppG family protein n=1 Tax=Bacillus TaxID=1386 RepID=UPI00017A66B0|nr:YppG family protein [Bacillus pumilus]EDW20857.1 YppG [Bacillus pumilus ATCC 7061]MCY7500051.1 YppG family protein [Bacillus pumilus]MCY7504708.1 YppG family protein [Bacillus pumilus]MCY7528625.1 YppG family protein [Bacillus pumilus]MDR4269924.1 spore coat protein [Bacillus pumilus]